ncbi:MAG: hypothetical protein B6245_17725 [Desulfobacteraceae bacterium 4572_88]|nr:MAG: hypothetical protein B6245_17725 [Desulfobacteraceae bacterium 4572_88]
MEEYEEAVTAYRMIADGMPESAKVRELIAVVQNCLNELKGDRRAKDSFSLSEKLREIGEFLKDMIARPPFAPVYDTAGDASGLLDKIRELGETLKNIVSPGIQWNLAFCMGTKEDDEKTSIRLPRMLRVSGDRKGDEVCLDIGSVIISSGMEQISHEILTRFLERLNSGKETFYYQVLLNDPDRGWSAFPDEPGEIYDLEIPVRGTVPDCFVLLLDTKSESLRDSTGNLMRFLEHSDEKSAMEISSSTLVMFVETDKN